MGCESLSATGSVGLKPVLITNVPGGLRGWYLFNSNSVTVYLQFFDKASDGSVNVGQDPPVLSIGIPAGSGANVIGCIRDFVNGIVIACTTGRANAVAPANTLDFNLFFC